MKIFSILLVSLALVISLPTSAKKKEKPTVFTIGDSTVKNGSGIGDYGKWGWGDPIVQYFDTTQVKVENYARGGTSSRSYRTLGLWKPVLDKIQKGDFVLMQFGHNDNGPLNDKSRARGTIKGISDETVEIDNMLTGKYEVVHSYGWYMTQYIKEIKAKGATPIVMSPIPRNDWVDNKVPRNDQSYGLWAKQVAEKEGVLFIDLNLKMVNAMNKLGEENVTDVHFWKSDHTHTTAKGAVLAASLLVEGITENPSCELNQYLLENPSINFPRKKKILLIGDSTVANGKDLIVGWGKHFNEYVDTSRVMVINKARGGRSSRTFMYEGLWEEALAMVDKGDFVIMQFGHNDGGYIDKPKFRGSFKGTGDKMQEITRPDGTKEVVRTYGWYMTQYIKQAKAKGVTPIILSHIPRNEWRFGKVELCDQSYGLWSRRVADVNQAIFIDLNKMVAEKYEKLGPKVVAEFFPKDHTHTNNLGALINARTVAEGVRADRKNPLRPYIDLD